MGYEIPEKHSTKSTGSTGRTSRISSMVDILAERHRVRSELLERAAELKKCAESWKKCDPPRCDVLMQRSRILSGEASLMLKRSKNKDEMQKAVEMGRYMLDKDRKQE